MHKLSYQIRILGLIYIYRYATITGTHAIRPAFESSPELCPFTNHIKINDMPSEMTPKIDGMKYFRRTNESRDLVPHDKAMSICKMYDLETAEILDQDDYNEIISIVKGDLETSWTFWIAVKGRYQPEFGDLSFDFTLADGFTKIGYHDFGRSHNDAEMLRKYPLFQEGCVSVLPNPDHPTGVSWSKTPCTELHDILCQYPKSCYRPLDYIKDPTRPVDRLKPLVVEEEEDSGYFISLNQVSWPLAKQICEDAHMSLVWFHDENEHTLFINRMLTFSAGAEEYQGKAIWTGAKFSRTEDSGNIYDSLYTWVHNVATEVPNFILSNARSNVPEDSGGFSKTWGIDQESVESNTKEPYDEGFKGLEKCVNVKFDDKNKTAIYYTSKCEQHIRYFVCKNPRLVKQTLNRPEVSIPSSMEYCDGDQYNKFRRKECNSDVLFASPEKPDCTCYDGIHGLMVDGSCKPKLLVGSGCTKFKARKSLHWKILPADIAHNKKPWIVVAHSTDSQIYNWFAVDISESAKRQILGTATIFFYGFDLYAYNRPNSDLCFVVSENASLDEFYAYEVSTLPSYILRYYMYDFDCQLDQVSKENLTTHQVSVDKNDCDLSCDAKSLPDIELPTSPAISVPPSATEKICPEDDQECLSTADIHSDSEMPVEGGKAVGDVGDVNYNVNRQLLIQAVEMAFQNYISPTDSLLIGPRNTWTILEKLFDLAKQTCQQMVSSQFLNRVLKQFKVAHFGENFGFEEHFTESETQQILNMLDTCQENARTVRNMQVEVDECTGRASKITFANRTGVSISRSIDVLGYQAVLHHHVFEAAWDVIDLWNAVCISEFKSSYLLYHHLERGMEVLFNDKLKKLWHFPDVNQEYYQKLLGPDEAIQLFNLDQCIMAAYKGNVRVNRLGRPNRGTGYAVGQMMRNRLDDDNLKKKGIPRKSINDNEDTVSKIKTACVKGPTIHCRRTSKPKKSSGLLAFTN